MIPCALEHVVIVGGAIVGSFVAWSLREQGFRGRVTVIEKDPTYQLSSTALSAASIRTQFGTAVNVHMSLYGVEFFRAIKTHFGTGADIGFAENGYLILSDDEGADARRTGAEWQRAQGADIVVLEPDELARRFRFLNTDGIALGTFGQSGEGWFDAWSLLSLVRKSARDRHVTFIHSEVTGLRAEGFRVTGVCLHSGDVIDCDWCVNAAGPSSSSVVSDLGIDLPVSPRKRTVFCFKSPVDPAGFPMLFDPSGGWVRPEGEGFIGGIQPPEDRDGDASGDFEPDHDLLEEVFWPLIASRVPTMEQLRLERSWAGHYEVNALDHNGIVGPHHELANLIFATGFSGHGVMHAPAAGRGVAELVVHGGYRSLDLSPLSWDRVHDRRPLLETVII